MLSALALGFGCVTAIALVFIGCHKLEQILWHRFEIDISGWAIAAFIFMGLGLSGMFYLNRL